MRSKSRVTPGWCRRLLFLSVVGGVVTYLLYRRDPDTFVDKVCRVGLVVEDVWDGAMAFFAREEVVPTTVSLTREA